MRRARPYRTPGVREARPWLKLTPVRRIVVRMQVISPPETLPQILRPDIDLRSQLGLPENAAPQVFQEEYAPWLQRKMVALAALSTEERAAYDAYLDNWDLTRPDNVTNCEAGYAYHAADHVAHGGDLLPPWNVLPDEEQAYWLNWSRRICTHVYVHGIAQAPLLAMEIAGSTQPPQAFLCGVAKLWVGFTVDAQVPSLPE